LFNRFTATFHIQREAISSTATQGHAVPQLQGKSEGKFATCLTKYHTMMMYFYTPKHHAMETKGSGCITPHILNLSTQWRDWSASHGARDPLNI